MSNLAIRFDSVSKKYRLRHGWYLSIIDEIARLANRTAGRSSDADYFWALKDVSFEIDHGDTVGLIGSNGAGKSTALKILSRVTVPTSGSFQTNGRVGALIEVGAGFHPDLSGRENVYLNGAIMGMRKREIDAKFDQIVAFSEVEKFIDTPLKFYSSGMMVRLGFAVAAHIEPDILLVDEVLAVGDTAFQAKCLNKIAELKQQNKTIVLVSHTMPSILQHSSRVLWIDKGTVRAFGDPESTVEQYLKHVHQQGASGTAEPAAATESPIRIAGISLLDATGHVRDSLAYGEEAMVEIAYELAQPVDDPVFSVTFHDIRGVPLGGLTSRLDGLALEAGARQGTVRLVLAPVLFTRGTYGITAAIYDKPIQRYYDMRAHAVSFMVDGPSVATREVSGHFVFPHRWEVVVPERAA